MRECCEKERESFHKSRWGDTTDSDEFEPDSDQGFLPTRLSVKRRGIGLGEAMEVR